MYIHVQSQQYNYIAYAQLYIGILWQPPYSALLGREGAMGDREAWGEVMRLLGSGVSWRTVAMVMDRREGGVATDCVLRYRRCTRSGYRGRAEDWCRGGRVRVTW